MFLLVGVSVFVHMAVVFGTVCRFVLVGVFVGLALLIYVMIVLCYLFLVVLMRTVWYCLSCL